MYKFYYFIKIYLKKGKCERSVESTLIFITVIYHIIYHHHTRVRTAQHTEEQRPTANNGKIHKNIKRRVRHIKI